MNSESHDKDHDDQPRGESQPADNRPESSQPPEDGSRTIDDLSAHQAAEASTGDQGGASPPANPPQPDLSKTVVEGTAAQPPDDLGKTVVEGQVEKQPKIDQTIEFSSRQTAAEGPDSGAAGGANGPDPSQATLDDLSSAADRERQLTEMWAGQVPKDNKPQMTIRLDSTVKQGTSTLVVKSRSVLNREDHAAPNADYELLDVIGEGGMGVVYAARQASVDRTVAVKMLKSDFAGASDQRDKFISEAVVTGDLDHPNIVPIYDLGTNEDNALFYSMKRVRGTPWDSVIRRKSLVENLDILMRVCDAVAFAHATGVIHRDLKPENVMLGDFGEVLVMDWGLALATEDFRHSGKITQSGSMGGTPAYMSPEMAIGPIEAVTQSSDVYLVGAILYEIVTGQLPHTGNSVMECLKAAARNRIQPTDKSGELLDIAYQAMSTKPEDRYASVKDFQAAIREYQSHAESHALSARAQEDLEAAEAGDDYEAYSRALFGFQESLVLWDQNTKAREMLSQAKLRYARTAMRKEDYDLGASLLDRANPDHAELLARIDKARRERDARQQRFKNLRRVAVGLAATVFIVVTGALFLVMASRNRAIVAEGEARMAEGAARDAEAVAKTERQEAVVARDAAETAKKVAVSERERAENEKDRADQERLRAETEKDRAEAARIVAVEAKTKEEYESYIARIGLAKAKIDENAFDAALRILADCKPSLRHWEWGRLMHLCQQSVANFRSESPVDSVAFSPDGNRIITGSWDGKARIWDAAAGKLLATIEHGQYVHAVAFLPDGRHVATAGSDRNVRISDADDGSEVRSFGQHDGSILSLDFSHDGRQLLTSSYDRTARLWDVASGKSLHEFQGHNWWVWTARFSPDDQRMVTASQDGKAIVWSLVAKDGVEQYGSVAEFTEHDGPVYDAAFSPDGKQVVSGGFDRKVLIWNPDRVVKVDIKKRLDGIPQPTTPYRLLAGHDAAVRSVRFSDNGALVLTGGQDNTVRVWDAAGGRAIKVLRGHGGQVRSCAFSPDGKSVLSGSHDSQAKLWSIEGYEEVRVLRGRVLEGHFDAVLSAAFSPDGNRIVTASRDRSAKTWNAATGEPLVELTEGHQYLATTAVFFPDGTKLLTAAGDNTVRTWDVLSGTELLRLDHTGRSGAATLSPSGKWILTGSDKKTANLYDAAIGQLLREIVPGGDAQQADNRGDVTAVAFSHDEARLAVGDAYGDCWIWRHDPQSGEWTEEHHLEGHGSSITAAVFLPDDKRLLTASGDKTVAQWDVVTGKELRDQVLNHDSWVNAIALLPDRQHALTCSQDGKVQLWDLQTARVTGTLEVDGPVNFVAVSPDGRQALTTSAAKGKVRLWDLQTGSEIPNPAVAGGALLDFEAMGGLVWSATFSPDGQYVITIGGNDARLWNLRSGRENMSFSPHGAVASANFSPDASRVVTGSWDNSAKVWNASSGKSIAKLAGGHTNFVNTAVFSPDGVFVLTASDDGTARLWTADTGEMLDRAFVGHTDRVRGAAFSPDAARIITASNDKTARIWDAQSAKTLVELRGHAWAVRAAAFSADGTKVITASEDNTAKIWNADSGELIVTLEGHSSTVTAAALSPDGYRALTASQDNTAKLWDAETGKEILTMVGHTQEVTSVSFSPDGQNVLTSSRDGSAILWLAVSWTDPVETLVPNQAPPATKVEPTTKPATKPAAKAGLGELFPTTKPKAKPADSDPPAVKPAPASKPKPEPSPATKPKDLGDLFPNSKPAAKETPPADKPAATPGDSLFPPPKTKPNDTTKPKPAPSIPPKPPAAKSSDLDSLFPGTKPPSKPANKPESKPDTAKPSPPPSEQPKAKSPPAKPSKLDSLFPDTKPPVKKPTPPQSKSPTKTPAAKSAPAKKSALESLFPGTKPPAAQPDSKVDPAAKPAPKKAAADKRAPDTPAKPAAKPSALDSLFPPPPLEKAKPSAGPKPSTPPQGLESLFPNDAPPPDKSKAGVVPTAPPAKTPEGKPSSLELLFPNSSGKPSAKSKPAAPSKTPGLDELFPDTGSPATKKGQPATKPKPRAKQPPTKGSTLDELFPPSPVKKP